MRALPARLWHEHKERRDQKKREEGVDIVTERRIQGESCPYHSLGLPAQRLVMRVCGIYGRNVFKACYEKVSAAL